MLLTAKERIILLSILPNENTNYITLKVVHDLKMNAALSDEEFDKVETNEQSTRIEGLNKIPDKEIKIGNKAKEIVLNSLVKLDKANKLTFDHFTLCEKFNLGKKLEELKRKENEDRNNSKK